MQGVQETDFGSEHRFEGCKIVCLRNLSSFPRRRITRVIVAINRYLRAVTNHSCLLTAVPDGGIVRRSAES